LPGILTAISIKNGFPSMGSKEVLGMARRMADQTGERVAAALVGARVSSCQQELAAWGADVVYLSENERLAEFHPNIYLKVFQDIAAEARPHTLLFPAEPPVMDLAPRLAFRLAAGLVTDCLDFKIQDGKSVLIKPVYGGKALALLRVTTPVILATVRARTQEPFPRDASRVAELVVVDSPIQSIPQEMTVIDRIEEESEEIKLEEARIVVSGGRGLGGSEAFQRLRQLARILSGAVGASRTAVDAGWIPSSHQVGQTGKIVAPDVYFAIAISGASQHIAGMGGSKIIVAINRDPEAPIMRIANLGVIEDYRNVLPALIDEFSRILNKG